MEEEDAGQWVLTGEERALVTTKNRTQRLAFAIMLLFYRTRGQFPKDPAEVKAALIAQVAKQLRVPKIFGDGAIQMGAPGNGIAPGYERSFDLGKHL